jgi:hypothetical protein
MMLDILLPEVKPLTQSARFFRKDEQDFIEVSFVGSKDTVIQRVGPGHMAQFKAEWDAFCDGRPIERRAGTPLTALAGITPERAEFYLARNIHTLEELAALSDAQCQSVGHGTLTDRKGAIALVLQRQLEARDKAQRAVQEATAAIGPKPADAYVTQSEIALVKSELAELKTMLAALVGKPVRARTKKAKAD